MHFILFLFFFSLTFAHEKQCEKQRHHHHDHCDDVTPKCLTNVVIEGIVCKCSHDTKRIFDSDGSFACITGTFNCNATQPLVCCDSGYHINLTTRTCNINKQCSCVNGTNGLNGTCIPCVNGTNGIDGANSTVPGPPGPQGIQGNPGLDGTNGTNAVVEFAAFFGMTAGPGNTVSDDYPATITISGAGPSVAGSSAINFPRAMVTGVGGIVINNPGVAQTDNTEFLLPSIGVYKVSWHISVNEAAQWSLWISTTASPAPGGTFNQLITTFGSSSNIGQATGTSQLSGEVIFDNTVANSAIQIRNYGSVSALTVTPLPGGTQAQAVTIFIERLS